MYPQNGSIANGSKRSDLNVSGLDITDAALDEVLSVSLDALRDELPQVQEHLAKFGDQLPAPVRAQFEALKQRLGA